MKTLAADRRGKEGHLARALQIFDVDRMLRHAEIACAMSLEALLANLKPYDTRVHELRGFPGAIRSAKAITRCIEGSDLQTGAIKTKVQDAYSMRYRRR